MTQTLQQPAGAGEWKPTACILSGTPWHKTVAARLESVAAE
jgi:hypothetical protein